MNIRIITLFILIAAISFSIIGCGGGGGSSIDMGNQLILSTSATPSNIGYMGGLTVIKTEVTDFSKVSSATALITSSAGGSSIIELLYSGVNNFLGSYNAPSNSTSSAVTYSVSITVIDKQGRTHRSNTSFRVNAYGGSGGGDDDNNPPPPPVFP
ncbi:MAG: hypothetical protein SNJ70_01930 [Armatimonadota bacterium]